MSSKLLAQVSETGLNLASPVIGTAFSGLPAIRIQNAIKFTIGALIVVGAIGFFLYLLVGGVQWIFSGGEKEAVEKAKRKVTHAVIGLVILFSAYAIVALIDRIFLGGSGGLFTPNIPSLLTL